MGISMSSSPPKNVGVGVPGARSVGPEQRPESAAGSRRRRPGWIWGGLGAVLVSAVGFTWIVSSVGEREEVLILARDVAAGEVLAAEDLRSVKVAADSGVVPVGRREEALGERARVPLVAGALLSPGMVGRSAAFPAKGSSQVTFAVEPAAGPSDLARGDRVAVLPGPDGREAAAEQAEGQEPETSVVGTVTGVRSSESAGGVREVRVLVETGAVRVATGIEHPRIVVLPAEGREAP